jgi:dihydropteroate synthase
MQQFTDYQPERRQQLQQLNRAAFDMPPPSSISGSVPPVVDAVRQYLSERVQAAIAAGVPRWNIILDPGIGFAKTAEQNIELIRHLPQLRKSQSASSDSIQVCHSTANMPLLLGVSRKAFIGKLTNQPIAANRIHGTDAANSACVAGGADVIRVHDVQAANEVCRVADAIWRL